MFSVNRKTMKLPANSNVENPIYNLGGVPKCTITHWRIGFNLLSAPRTCPAVPQVVRHFHTTSISSPMNSETRSIVPVEKEEKTMSPKLTCQDLPHQIMMTYAEVVKSVSRRPMRRRRNKFWQTSPRVLSSNWRESTPVPEMSSTTSKVQENVPIELECVNRDRKQSESSQASEDSWVVFERDSGCSYDSEVSSQPSSDSDSDTETESSSDSEESNSPIATDSGHNSESDEEIFLKVGDGDSVSLPPKVRLPPLRSSSRSSSSVNEESEDSDDDWIAKEKTEESHGERRDRVKMVRFAAEEEMCYLYDDDDHRAARCGEWEEKARDRTRFRARIMSTAEVIAPILNPDHRRKIMQSRFS
ncbi:hypothetical protein B566_EDAN015452 [Ephemera danica]|nr:hypothetical protein B566_EDAN015452 [Ephemera danica]